MNNKKFSKLEILEKIKTGRGQFENNLIKFSDEQWVVVGEIGEWSIKDLVSHIVAWEQRLLVWAKEGVETGLEPEDYPESWDDLHRMNDESFKLDRNKTLSIVKSEFKKSGQQIVDFLESIPSELIEDLEKLNWKKTPLWMMIAAITWKHYQEHLEDLEKITMELKA